MGAKVGVEVLGDSTGLNVALGESSAALLRFGELYETTYAGISAAALKAAVAQDKLAISTAKFGVGTTGAAQAALAYRRTLDGIAASQLAAAQTVGRSLTTFVTAPTLLAGYAATKMAMSFEASMRLIKTQAGASTAELGVMTSGVLNLAKSGQSFGQSANDMAQALFFIESEGIRGAAALNILRVASAGAAVGQAGLADTTNALTSAMHVFNVAPKDAAATMATLNAAVGAGKLHMDDLNAVLGTKLLPTAKEFGITLPQILAGVDIFTKSGPQAASSATSLTQALIKMVAPTGAGKKALSELGLSATELGQQLRQGGLPAALGTLSAAYDKLVSSQGKGVADQAVIASFGGSKGGSSALLAIQQYANYMTTLGQAQKNNSPATFWNDVAAQMKLPSTQIKADQAKIGASMIEIGTAIAPVVAHIANDVSDIVDAFEKLPKPVKDATGAMLAGLAIGGPIILGTVAVARAIKTIGTAFNLTAAQSAVATTEIDTDLAGVGTAAVGAETGVLGLRAALLSLGAGDVLGALAPLTALFGPAAAAVFNDRNTKVLGNLPVGEVPGTEKRVVQNGKDFYLENQVHLGRGGASAAKKKISEAEAYKLLGKTPPSASGQKVPAVGSVGSAPSAVTGGGSTVGLAPSGTAPLTAAQKLQLQIAANPNDATFLNEKIAADNSAIAWLKKRRDEGKVTAATYVKDLTSLYDDRQSAEETVASLQTKAAAATKKLDTFALPYALQLMQAQAAVTPSLTDDAKSTAVVKAFIEKRLKSGQLGPQARLQALGQLASLQTGAAGSYAISPALQLADARNQALGNTAGLMHDAQLEKAAAMKAINSHKLTVQEMTDAWNVIAQANQTLGTTVTKNFRTTSLESLTAGLGLTPAKRKEAEMRYAQSEAHSGHAPTGHGIAGASITINVHGSNADEISDKVVAKIQRTATHHVVRTRGPNAGRGHPIP